MSDLFWPLNILDRKLDTILANQATILANLASEKKSMSAISDAIVALQAQVSAETTANQSAITLIQGLAQQLKDALANAADATAAVAAVTDIANTLQSNTSSLAAAVTANTPAAPAPAPTPPPAP